MAAASACLILQVEVETQEAHGLQGLRLLGGYAGWLAGCGLQRRAGGEGQQLVAVCVKGACGEEEQGEKTALGENQSAECAACEAGRRGRGGAGAPDPPPPQ